MAPGPPAGHNGPMDEAPRTDVDAATDDLYSHADEHLRPLHDAIVEITHDLDDEDGRDIDTQATPGAILLTRSDIPFVALRPGPDCTLEVGFRMPAGIPSEPGLERSDGFAGTTHRTLLPTDALDDDVRAIEPWLGAAFDQAG